MAPPRLAQEVWQWWSAAFIGEVIVPVRSYGERGDMGRDHTGRDNLGRDHTGRESIICGERDHSAPVHMGRRS